MKKRRARVVQNPRGMSAGIDGASSAVPKPSRGQDVAFTEKARLPGATQEQLRHLRRLTHSPIPTLTSEMAQRAIGLLESGQACNIVGNGRVIETLRPIPPAEREAHKSQLGRIRTLTHDLKQEHLTRREAESIIRALERYEDFTLRRGGKVIKTYYRKQPS